MPTQDRYPRYLRDQRQFFDELITEDWTTYASEAWDYGRRHEVARLFRRIRPRTILDLGCGCGFHDREMANYPFVERVLAIDYSPRSVERAALSYSHPKIEYRVAAFESLEESLEERTRFDLVVSFQVFEHLDNPEAYLEKARALTAPGGFVAIVTPNGRRLDNRVRRWRGKRPVLLDPQHFKEYAPDEVCALGRRHGLRPVDRFGHTLYLGGAALLESLPFAVRHHLGMLVPAVAHIIGVVFRRDDG